MVRAQHDLATRGLGLTRLHAVGGNSMGAFQTIEWGVTFPGFMKGLLLWVPAARSDNHFRAIADAMAGTLTLDAGYRDGAYTDNPVEGIRRAILVYFPWVTTDAYLRTLATEAAYQEARAAFAGPRATAWDANSILWRYNASKNHDVSKPYGGDMTAALARVTARALIVAGQDDRTIPAYLTREMYEGLRDAVWSEVPSDKGHLATAQPPGHARICVRRASHQGFYRGTLDAHAGRHRRRWASRSHAFAVAPQGRDLVGGAGGQEPEVCRGTHSRRRAGAHHGRADDREWRRRAVGARRPGASRLRDALWGKRRRIDLAALTGGRTITVYPQHEVVKDLIAARLAAGGEIRFEADVTDIDGIEGTKPTIHYREGGTVKTLTCDFIAGCDGFHGVCRPAMPAKVMKILDRTYPFAWLGILAQAPPASHELIYTRHDRGFSLLSMRTPQITRLYLQCAPDEDIAQWSDDRIWAELHERNKDVDGLALNEGPITQKGITPMRSFVAEPMRHGRLFLMGDAAHIVPPTGAKGLNLAVNDVRVFARAADAFYRDGGTGLLDAYSETCLKRVWRVQHFSWWMTSMLHRFPDASEFERRLQLSELDFVTSNEAAARALAENYVGLPYG